MANSGPSYGSDPVKTDEGNKPTWKSTWHILTFKYVHISTTEHVVASDIHFWPSRAYLRLHPFLNFTCAVLDPYYTAIYPVVIRDGIRRVGLADMGSKNIAQLSIFILGDTMYACNDDTFIWPLICVDSFIDNIHTNKAGD